MSGGERLISPVRLSLSLTESIVSVPVMLAHFINLSFFISSLVSSLSALEKEAHRERHCHHNLSGAGSVAFHPSEYSLTLPACLCNRPCAQPLL